MPVLRRPVAGSDVPPSSLRSPPPKGGAGPAPLNAGSGGGLMSFVSSLELVPAALAGDTRAIARLLTRAESGSAEARPALDAMFAHAGRAHVVGIPGVPGSAK